MIEIIFVYLLYKEIRLWVYGIGYSKGLYIDLIVRRDRIPRIYVGYNIRRVYLKSIFKRKKNLF